VTLARLHDNYEISREMPYGVRRKCVHGRRPSRCKDGCGGEDICPHGRQKNKCKEGCGVSKCCPHGKRHMKCKVLGCWGGMICPHGKESAHYCAACGGAGLCKHGRLNLCFEGCREALCIHQKDKDSCVNCKAAEARCLGGRRRWCKCTGCVEGGGGRAPRLGASGLPRAAAR
jgi:hypothetical protein